MIPQSLFLFVLASLTPSSSRAENGGHGASMGSGGRRMPSSRHGDVGVGVGPGVGGGGGDVMNHPRRHDHPPHPHHPPHYRPLGHSFISFGSTRRRNTALSVVRQRSKKKGVSSTSTSTTKLSLDLSQWDLHVVEEPFSEGASSSSSLSSSSSSSLSSSLSSSSTTTATATAASAEEEHQHERERESGSIRVPIIRHGGVERLSCQKEETREASDTKTDTDAHGGDTDSKNRNAHRKNAHGNAHGPSIEDSIIHTGIRKVLVASMRTIPLKKPSPKKDRRNDDARDDDVRDDARDDSDDDAPSAASSSSSRHHDPSDAAVADSHADAHHHHHQQQHHHQDGDGKLSTIPPAVREHVSKPFVPSSIWSQRTGNEFDDPDVMDEFVQTGLSLTSKSVAPDANDNIDNHNNTRHNDAFDANSWIRWVPVDHGHASEAQVEEAVHRGEIVVYLGRCKAGVRRKDTILAIVETLAEGGGGGGSGGGGWGNHPTASPTAAPPSSSSSSYENNGVGVDVDDEDFYGSRLPIVRTESIVPFSPSAMADLLLDSSRVKAYNKLSLGRKDVRNINHASGVTKIVENWTQPPVVGSQKIRSTTMMHSRALPDGSYIVVSRAVPIPPPGKALRASTTTTTAAAANNNHHHHNNNDNDNNNPGNDVQSPNQKKSDGDGGDDPTKTTASEQPNPSDGKYGVSEILLGINLLVPHDDGKSSRLTAITHVYSKALPVLLASRVGVKSSKEFVRDIRDMKKQR